MDASNLTKPTKYVSHQESSDLETRQSNIPSLVCAFYASATTGGAIYAFGIVGEAIKNSLHLTQLQLGSISAAFFVAGLLSWIPGIVVDRMKMRFSMAAGGFTGALFTLIYWSLCRYPPRFMLASSHQAVLVLGFLAVCISMSCGLIVGSIFKLTLQCGGRKGKGPSVGVAKGLVGVGSGVYATVFQAFRTENESALDFFPVIGLFFLVCAALPAVTLLPPREKFHPHLMVMETTVWHFRTMYVALAVLCVVIVGIALGDILQQQQADVDEIIIPDGTDVGGGRHYGKVAMILLLWLGPIASLLYLPREDEDAEEPVPESEALVSTNQQTSDHGHQSSYGSASSTPRHENREGEQPQNSVRADLSLPEMLQTTSAWLMLWTTVVLIGSGTTKTNNMGEMVQSLQLDEAVTPATLTLFSVAQSGARIMTGIFSETALQRYGLPRPVFLVVASIVMLVAHVLLATSVGTTLVGFVAGCTISAIAFGMAWPLMVLIVGDIFGVEHHGANYMFFDGVTKAIGTSLLSQYVAGTVYEAHIIGDDDMNSEPGDSLTCLGVECFRETHVVIIGLSLTCIVTSLILCRITQDAYSQK